MGRFSCLRRPMGELEDAVKLRILIASVLTLDCHSFWPSPERVVSESKGRAVAILPGWLCTSGDAAGHERLRRHFP
jgi:hypothetical protein